MSTKTIYGIFEDDDIVLSAIKKLKDNNFRVTDVISPFPVHGMDEALGLKRTRIATASFLYGATGTCLALLMMWYMNIFDWPMNIGGKPSFALYKNLPAFIPITFEITVLCAAHGMALTFFLRSKILPGVEPKIIDQRMADDRFVMSVEVKSDQEKELAFTAMKDAGALYVKE